MVDLTSPADAQKECAHRANAFLGTDWRLGWVQLQPVPPTDEARAGGARWVRCDVLQTSPVDGAEFAGLYESKRARPADMTSAEMAKGCGTAIARFAGPAKLKIQYVYR